MTEDMEAVERLKDQIILAWKRDRLLILGDSKMGRDGYEKWLAARAAIAALSQPTAKAPSGVVVGTCLHERWAAMTTVGAMSCVSCHHTRPMTKEEASRLLSAAKTPVGEVTDTSDQSVSCFCAKLDPVARPCLYCNRLTHSRAAKPDYTHMDREGVAQYIMAIPSISLEEAFARHRIQAVEAMRELRNIAASYADASDRAAIAVEAEAATLRARVEALEEALSQIMLMGYAGAPDIEKRNIARAALSESPKQ